jgi:methionyl-tRNA formyltransferase
VEGTPSGATLHYVDEGIDTGDIIAQEKVAVELTDTGESLYRKLEKSCVYLFKQYWPLIRDGKELRIPQSSAKGTYHATEDVKRIDEIELDRKYVGRDLINIIRARTFPPYKGAFFRDGDKKIYMRIDLLKEEDLDD